MGSDLYKRQFYEGRNENTSYAASTVLSLLKSVLPSLNSAIDLGCGVGTWLAEAKKLGCESVVGVDGPWVQKDLLQIPEECFFSRELHKERWDGTDHFDLCISLEVAEHIAQDKAAEFVATLTALADFVLFSAAIPRQGGKGHVNEQWPDYWVALFEKCDFELCDVIRPQIWMNEKTPFWYRQNILLFVKKGRQIDLSLPEHFKENSILNIVHPDFYDFKIRQFIRVLDESFEDLNEAKSLKKSGEYFSIQIKHRIKKLLGLVD